MPIPVAAMTSTLSMTDNGFSDVTKIATASVAALGAAVAAAGAAIIKFTADQFPLIDQTAKLGAQLRISGDTLRAYELGIARAGESLATYETAMRKLPRSIGQAMQGLATQKRALEGLGFELKELSELGAEEQFIRVADALSKMENASLQAATAADLFGRSGQKLLPFISQGREGLEQMKDESLRLNGAISDLEASKIEEANDALTEMGIAFNSIFKQLAIAVAPAVELFADTLTEIFIKARENMPMIIEKGKEITIVFLDFVQQVAPLWSTFLIESIKLMDDMEAKIKTLSLATLLWAKTIENGAKELELESFNKTLEEQRSLWDGIVGKIKEAVTAVNKLNGGLVISKLPADKIIDFTMVGKQFSDGIAQSGLISEVGAGADIKFSDNIITSKPKKATDTTISAVEQNSQQALEITQRFLQSGKTEDIPQRQLEVAKQQLNADERTAQATERLAEKVEEESTLIPIGSF